jgi:tetratricopeptide (TPR) repeat protein
MKTQMPVLLLCLLLSFAGWAQEGNRHSQHKQVEKETKPSATIMQDSCPNLFTNRDHAIFLNAVEAYNNKQYSEAATLLRKISGHNVKAPDPYFYLGMIAVKRNDNPGAIRRYFSKLLEVCPHYPNALAHYWKGVVDYSDERYSDAVIDLQHYFDIANRENNVDYLAVYEEASNYLFWSQFLADAYANPVPFMPLVLHGASSAGNEILPFITADNNEVYYLRQIVQRRRDAFFQSENEERKMRLIRSVWKDTAFTKGEELAAPFNQHDNEGGVSLTADKRLLYYSILENEEGYNNCDIYFSTFENGRWQMPQNAGSNVNGKKSWESQPSLSADGQWLYFASNREGGRGGTDIWRCHRLPNGDWSRAENLGSSVNTEGDEKCPFLHADGHTLYFASNGWQGFGGYDEYFIDLNNVNLVRPTNMGLPVNSEDDNISFGVTTDGQTAYFSGRQPVRESEDEKRDTTMPVSSPWPSVGGTDLYQFSLYANAQPEPMQYCAGRLSNDAGNAVGGTITVLREGYAPFIFSIPGEKQDSLQPGRFAIVLSRKVNNTVIVSAAGCAPVIFGNLDGQHRLLPSTITLQPLALDKRYTIPIAPGDPLSEACRQCLDAYAVWLLQNPMIHVRLECAGGAKDAYDYLLGLGLRAERLAWKDNSATDNLQIIITQK